MLLFISLSLSLGVFGILSDLNLSPHLCVLDSLSLPLSKTRVTLGAPWSATGPCRASCLLDKPSVAYPTCQASTPTSASSLTGYRKPSRTVNSRDLDPSNRAPDICCRRDSGPWVSSAFLPDTQESRPPTPSSLTPGIQSHQESFPVHSAP